jgi:hypothetical protein
MDTSLQSTLPMLLLAAAASFASASTHAADSQKLAGRIASFVEGRLIVVNDIAYRAADVKGTVDTTGKLHLTVDADPLYYLQPIAEGSSEAGRLKYTIPAHAKCGQPEVSREIASTGFSLRQGNSFVGLENTLRTANIAMPEMDSGHRLLELSASDVQKMRTCARAVEAHARTQPFHAVRLHARETVLNEVRRTATAKSVFELGHEHETSLTHLVVVPKKGYSAADFSITVSAVSVMHCSDAHMGMELDKWKQGVSPEKALSRKGEVFQIGERTLQSEAPAFPKFTRTELRRAMKVQRGEKGLASQADAKLCAPALQGHRFFVKHKGEVVHEVSVRYASGC